MTLSISGEKDEDEVFSAELEDVTVEGASYCNWVSPCVSLEKLVEYIRMKKEDSAFETEYKVLRVGYILIRC